MHAVTAHDGDGASATLAVEQLGDGVVDGVVVDTLGQLVDDVVAGERGAMPAIHPRVEGVVEGLGAARHVLREEFLGSVERPPEGPERKPVEGREEQHPLRLEPPERLGGDGATHEDRSGDLDCQQRLGEVGQVEALGAQRTRSPVTEIRADFVEIIELGQRREGLHDGGGR